MSISLRINELIKNKNLSKRQFYNQTGLSNGYLDKTKSIGSDKLESIISKFPDINLTWLLTGKGTMFIEEVSAGISVSGSNIISGEGNIGNSQIIGSHTVSAAAAAAEEVSELKKKVEQQATEIEQLQEKIKDLKEEVSLKQKDIILMQKELISFYKKDIKD